MHLKSLFTLSSSSAGVLVAFLLAATVNAQDRTTEAGEAKIKDPNQECADYDYPLVVNALPNFPAIWEVATILLNDTEAVDKYNSIKDQILALPPKGTQPDSLMGNFSTLTYPDTDPDCWWTDTMCTVPKNSTIIPDIKDVPEPRTSGMGYDDGPNCSHNAFYDYLLEKNQKATMYFIGSNVMYWPMETQRALADGHEICVHTWSHHYMTSLTNEQAFAEFWYSELSVQLKAIKLVAGVTPTCWRPPFGDVDDRIRSIAQLLGMSTIIWSYDSNDWEFGMGATAQQIDDNYMGFINAAKNGTFNNRGSIMLTHELDNFTMSEAMKFYDQLAGAFDHMVPVGVAYNKTQPYVETNYTLPSFAEYVSERTAKSNNTTPKGNSGGGGKSTGSSSSGSKPSDSPSGKQAGGKSGAMGQMVFSGMAVLAATAALFFGVGRVFA